MKDKGLLVCFLTMAVIGWFGHHAGPNLWIGHRVRGEEILPGVRAAREDDVTSVTFRGGDVEKYHGWVHFQAVYDYDHYLILCQPPGRWRLGPLRRSDPFPLIFVTYSDVEGDEAMEIRDAYGDLLERPAKP